MTAPPCCLNSSASLRCVLTPAVLCVCLLMCPGCSETEVPSVGVSGESGAPPVALAPSVAPPSPATGMMNTPFIVPPVIDPPMLPAVDAQVGPDEMVIGISSDGESRAWLVSALSDMQSHVVVDTRGPQPIAVTFCDRTRCSRVLAGQPGTSLRVQTAGFMNGEMWLQIDGQMLPQSSAKIPLRDLESVMTTWQEWKTAHPETTLFPGRLAEAAE